jgi:hypothetical protein
MSLENRDDRGVSYGRTSDCHCTSSLAFAYSYDGSDHSDCPGNQVLAHRPFLWPYLQQVHK